MQFGDCLQDHPGHHDPAGQLHQQGPEEDLDPEFLFHPDFEEDPWANELNFCSDVRLPSVLDPLEEPSGQ
eukprot:8641082-Pyramimonas_sp.AAC.1